MNTIRTAFLNRFSDFCNPSLYFINTMSVQLNQNNNSNDDFFPKLHSYGEVHPLEIQYPAMSNYDTINTDTDALRKFVNP